MLNGDGRKGLLNWAGFAASTSWDPTLTSLGHYLESYRRHFSRKAVAELRRGRCLCLCQAILPGLYRPWPVLGRDARYCPLWKASLHLGDEPDGG